MTVKYFYKGQKTTRKFLEELFGVNNIRRRIQEARNIWGKDPYVEVFWEDGVHFINGLIC